ncbi:MAG: hypothetical protein V7K27_27880 [Nostoc sp.]|uniref:hypothetical protein n=1 Tax=Nostoc sp. TaxID=1180 RepID=UPI002FFD576D
MKSTQIFSMFMSLTETEEASLCGGSVSFSNGNIIKVKSSLAKPGVKKPAVKSTSTTKVVKSIKGGVISDKALSDLLSPISFGLF